MREPNFHYFLTGISDIRALIAGRVYPDMLPQGVKNGLPAVVVSKTGTVRQGTNCGTDGLVLGSFQLDVYAATRREVRELSNRIIGSGRKGATPPTAMLDYKGMMGNCFVKNCALTTDFDSVDPDPGLLRRTQLWDIWYVERD
jgi:hypothetical protein